MITLLKNSKGWITGLFAAMAASLCCITPILALVGGASGLASSFSWIEPYRPYLMGLTIAVFAWAWYQKLKPKKQVDCDCGPENKISFLHTKSFLAIVTVISILLLTFPFYAKLFYPKPKQIKVFIGYKINIEQATFKIKGMTCESCTENVNNEISKVNGVITFSTSYKEAASTVKFDKSKTSPDSIASAINRTGYKVITQTVTLH